MIIVNQASSIKGKNIGDNILLAHEVIRKVHGEKGRDMFYVKADVWSIWLNQQGLYTYHDGQDEFSSQMD